MDFLIFLFLIPCCAILAVSLAVPIIHFIEFFSFRFLNKEIEVPTGVYVSILIFLGIVLLLTLFKYFTGLDVDYYSNINI